MHLRTTIVAISITALATSPVSADAQTNGPHFTSPFQTLYMGAQRINADGAGCPATGGPPTTTPPGVFVSASPPGSPVLPAYLTVENGQVVFTAKTGFDPTTQGLYYPVADDGTWTGTIRIDVGFNHLIGLCTTLIELNPDSQTINEASIAAATFTSPNFGVSPIPYPGTPSTTSTTTPPPQAVSATPTFTG